MGPHEFREKTGGQTGAVSGQLHWLARGFLDLLFPPRCEVCRELGTDLVCPRCSSEIELVQPPLCARCGQPFDPQARGAPLCAACRPGKRPFELARSAAYFEGPLRQAIHRFKYQRKRVLASFLGGIMVHWLSTQDGGALGAAELVCPVALYPRRRRERGFNQSELLARSVAAHLGVELDPDLLARVRDTVPQINLPLGERAANVRGAFAVPQPAKVAKKTVLLIDDVFTTGATLNECARLLRRAGAARVFIFTLARPLPRWRLPRARG
jgi:ComF family protein